jgi:hypothetical protein
MVPSSARLWGKGKALFVMRIIEHTEGHYEVQDLELGKVYRWHPEERDNQVRGVLGEVNPYPVFAH